MISRILLIGLLTLSVIFPSHAQVAGQFGDASWREKFRYSNEFAGIQHPFREVETFERKPLFAELPFLKLRAGDRIVRGQFLHQPIGKGVPRDVPKEWSDPGFYLVRGDKVTSLYAGGDGTTLDFSTTILPYFEWKPTRQNADALFEYWRAWRGITIAQLAALDTRLQPDYAEYLSPRLSEFVGEKPNWTPGFVEQNGAGERAQWIYAGFGFDGQEDGIYQYRLTLGTTGWLEERATLIQLPPLPRYPIGGQQQSVFNDPLPAMPDDWRHRFQAHDARYKAFFRIVQDVIKPPA